MLIPQRLLAAIRPQLATAVLVSLATSTAVFTATPFLLPAAAREFGISLATVGWMSTGQLAGFVVASWVGGRYLRPARATFVVGVLIGVVANLASAAVPSFALLVTARFASGLSLGLSAWFAWQAAFGDARKTGDAAVVGPLIGTIVAPVIALTIELAGLRWLFVAMAALAALPLAFVGQIDVHRELPPHRTRHSSTRAAQAILVALGMITLGGSAVFVYAAAIGEDLDGLTPLAVSLAFSGNALVSIPAAKWPGRRGPAGAWFVFTAACALAIAVSRNSAVFTVALVGWGFVFFMGVPATFQLLAARSEFPEERAGDAQAVMALGRVFGPLVGGALLAGGSTTALGVGSAIVIIAASGLLLFVDRRRFVVAQQWRRGTGRRLRRTSTHRPIR